MSDYLKGIDVSEHQGVIDWEKLKGRIDFAMIRAGYGKNHIDKQFVRNITEYNRLGIPVGTYWFSYAASVEEAKAEAAYCLAAIEPYEVEYPVCFDFEYASTSNARKRGVTVTKALASAMVAAFCGAIEAAGYYAMIYANADYLSRFFDASVPERFDLWLASWPTLEAMLAAIKSGDHVNAPRTCGIWQWGGKAYDGISGNVDSNVAYKDYAQIIRSWGLNHLTAAQPAAEETRAVYAVQLTKTNAEALTKLLADNGITAELKEVS